MNGLINGFAMRSVCPITEELKPLVRGVGGKILKGSQQHLRPSLHAAWPIQKR